MVAVLRLSKSKNFLQIMAIAKIQVNKLSLRVKTLNLVTFLKKAPKAWGLYPAKVTSSKESNLFKLRSRNSKLGNLKRKEGMGPENWFSERWSSFKLANCAIVEGSLVSLHFPNLRICVHIKDAYNECTLLLSVQFYYYYYFRMM